ncbi:bifunctional 3-(3-hydroxy-phenyl)propionate/3-hydroxycinnamic acid hydroxylase [Streptomyces olivaceus]|uniref:bifunctional 3-(3-hydroxy-phenyl)propionate/3-hydroxycinnamic acid hydroxylase MhpA n=1 Tax=Streptomyces olivaceus TaxID=47716 RepID=UPI00370153A9
MTVHSDDSAQSDQPVAHAVDVVVVGYGPVGQLLAVLLAEKGHEVAVVERWPSAYPLPRAVAFDGEAARILADAGVSDCFARIGESSRDYTVTNLAGDVLLRHDADDTYRNGWPDSTSMYQPGLEAALTERGAGLPGLRLFRDHEAVLLEQEGDHVTVEAVEAATGRRRRFTAGWVLGCDGANSFVRASVKPQFTDYGLNHEWLVCDVVLHEERSFEHNNLQLADPARPRVAVSAGPGHRRWEFMRMPQDDPGTFNSAEKAWELLELFDVHPGNASLDRFTSYTFQARLADRWRSGRVLIAGDAAHLMPPFAGQGMCSGLRDAANLAWKLDLVLRGVAGDGLLDTYALERGPHVKKSITMSVNLGKVICMTDTGAAADRDTVMLASRKRGMGAHRPQTVLERLKDGVVFRDTDGGPVGQAGHLTPQGRVAGARGTGRFDEVVGTGFVLLTAQNPAADTEGVLDDDHRTFLRELGARTVRVLPAGTPAGALGADNVVDVDQVYLPYLAEQSATVALVRPDFYLFGAVEHLSGLPALVESLRQQTAAAVVTG